MSVIFEFCVEGTPISGQARTRSRRRWINKVSGIAKQHWPARAQPIADPIAVKITYFYEGDALDADNMLKPIIDALKGIVYVDDDQVTDAKAEKRKIDGNFKVRGMSIVLAAAFVNGKEFVRVQVLDQPDQQDLN